LKGFEGRVEVGGRGHVVKVIVGGAELDEGRGGKKLLRIKITTEVDGVRSDYTITFSRHKSRQRGQVVCLRQNQRPWRQGERRREALGAD
jgi:hypothetical protein